MSPKLVFLFFCLQLCHLSMSMEIPQTFTQLSDSSKCVASCGKFNLQIGKKLYYVESKEKVNWYKAVNNCRKMGGYLLNIESSTEMDLFAALYPSDSLWTSLNSLLNTYQASTILEPGTFLSIATGEPMPYNRWKEGYLNRTELCVEMTKGFLDSITCVNLRYYVCQAHILY
ncbi:C-type lectin 37Db-like [Drosophila albomicans]|uniref:C-type lectin 37Db-like n=1 Tax=Drosophila albomicans TaxID=7291 RepID=A0A6P8WSE1_DROAB|nr:C-type lectin 37Db-like [Drosophila albomicans]